LGLHHHRSPWAARRGHTVVVVVYRIERKKKARVISWLHVAAAIDYNSEFCMHDILTCLTTLFNIE
jgi:hypothetical protein